MRLIPLGKPVQYSTFSRGDKARGRGWHSPTRLRAFSLNSAASTPLPPALAAPTRVALAGIRARRHVLHIKTGYFPLPFPFPVLIISVCFVQFDAYFIHRNSPAGIGCKPRELSRHCLSGFLFIYWHARVCARVRRCRGFFFPSLFPQINCLHGSPAPVADNGGLSINKCLHSCM